MIYYFIFCIIIIVVFSLKNETTKSVENFDQQIQEQEKLRQNIRTMLSILQRMKVQLIELRPTINRDGDQKLKVRLPRSFFVFDQFNSYLLEN